MNPPEFFLSRRDVIEQIRQRLSSESFPRLTMLVIVSLAGGCAFLCSALTLSAGLSSMAARYGLAALVGYVTFALLIRAWVALKRGTFDMGVDLPQIDLPSRGAGASPRFFSGGGSGGGGSSAVWEGAPVEAPAVVLPPAASPSTSASSGGGFLKSLDFDKAWLVVLAVALAGASLVAIGFVIYSAPLMLAEVALDAGVMTTVYRRLRHQDEGHWAGAVLRRTWLPAVVVIVFMAGAGYALQLAVPDARSIGGVFRALTK